MLPEVGDLGTAWLSLTGLQAPVRGAGGEPVEIPWSRWLRAWPGLKGPMRTLQRAWPGLTGPMRTLQRAWPGLMGPMRNLQIGWRADRG